MAASKIQAAFAHDTQLVARAIEISNIYQNDPAITQLLHDISDYTIRYTGQTATQSTQDSVNKKRKLNDAQAETTLSTSQTASNAVPSFVCNDVSASIPVRKKLKLELLASSSKTGPGIIRMIEPKTDTVEYTLNTDDVDQVFCLPVPDKAQRQQNYIFLPSTSTGAGSVPEQLVFTLNEAPDKTGSIITRTTTQGESETLVDVADKELDAFLARWRKQVVRPNEREFASTIPQSHRKGEKGYHVKAFRGSKEGYLFFLTNGILFGFKKPVQFFPFSDIHSISYTSVLQRTFNLVITPLGEDASPAAEIEFSMLDQADFAGIDAYIKAHGLNDASMAAERRAKMYNVNKDKTEEADGEAQADPDDQRTEIEKAEQELQDEEDELEEDYDPSGGESDGEGEESEEEDEGYADGNDDEMQDDEDDEQRER